MKFRVTDHPDRRAERCLGRLCGLVTGLEFKQSDREMGDFVATRLETTDISQTLPQRVEGQLSINASGGGWTTTEATTTSLCEFLERYSMYWPVENAVVRSHDDLTSEGKSVLDVEYLEVWDERDLEDAGLDPFDAETDIEWVPGVDVLSGDTVYVPTELVSFASVLDGPTRFPTSTSGTACGSSLAQATLGALYEQVERDAIMRTWYSQVSPSRLDLSGLPELARVRNQLTSAHSHIELLTPPTPTECSVVASAWVDDRDRVPKFLLFAGAHLTQEGAIRAALKETAEGLVQTKYRLAHNGDAPVDEIDPSRVYDFTKNVDYYMHPENFDSVRFMLDGDTVEPTAPSETTFHNHEEELRRVFETLAKTELTPIAVDITAADVQELGMYVVGTCIPELVAMALPGVPPVNHPELDDVSTEQGHPFP